MSHQTDPRTDNSQQPAAARLADITPLQGIPEHEQLQLLLYAGMHAPAPTFKSGCSSLLFRSDISLSEICETLSTELQQAQSLLTVLIGDSGELRDETRSDIASACMDAISRARGLHDIAFRALRNHGSWA